MLDLKKLKKEREEAYDVWFDRWWKRNNLVHEIKIANAQGYTGYTIALSNYSDDDKHRMSNERFKKKLQEKIPGIKTKFEYRTHILTKNEFLYGVTVIWA